jgi:hypothetical protein
MTAASGIILRCNCGATLSVPEGAAGARCPRCRAETRVAPAASGPPATSSNCPVCQTTVNTPDQWSRCGACGLVHHTECWTEVGGCGAYGCANAPAKKEDHPPTQANSAWGDTKKCPVCAETIRSIAVKCRYCGTELGTVDPLTSDEFRKRHEKGRQSEGMRNGVVGLFVLSILGLFAPITLVVALVLVIFKRPQLRAAGNLTLTLAIAAGGISALYSLLMLIFILISI